MLKQSPVPDAELRRAKDHLKGSLMLSLENTASRMSHLARQEIYFERHFSLDETLAGVERVRRRTCSVSRRTCLPTARWPRPWWALAARDDAGAAGPGLRVGANGRSGRQA